MLLALDSNVFISALSGKETDSLAAQRLIRDIAEGKHRAVASSIVYGEILGVSNDNAGELDLESFFSNIENLSTIAADDDICQEAGRLRIQYGKQLKLPDALHVVTAISAKVDMFITDDVPFTKVAQQLLPTVTLADWR